jgi:hypothetical protein
MNKLKIALTLIVLAAIAAGIFFWRDSFRNPEKEKASENQFALKIEQEIEQLKAKPDSKFCRDFYNQVAFHINDFHKQNRLGNNQSENDQAKENLENKLYAVYSDKFIMQAKNVFRGSEWSPDDLKFIQEEKNELKKSKLLVAGSLIDKELSDIQTVLNKHNEIVSFISACQVYDYSNIDLTARFPIDDVKSKISRATSLIKDRLENEYVNNCDRLHDKLKAIPQLLFSAHVSYLDKKIDNWSELYSNYNSQSDYSNNLYRPIRAQIEALDNDIYKVPNFAIEYDRLLKKWSADNVKAYDFNYKKN